MTVIAFDGKTLAADKRAGVDLPRTVTKIRRTASGVLIGCTGSVGRRLSDETKAKISAARRSRGIDTLELS